MAEQSEIKRIKVRSLESLGQIKFKRIPSNKTTAKGEIIYNFSIVESNGYRTAGIVSQGASALLAKEGRDAKGKLQISETRFTDNKGKTREANYLELIPLATREADMEFEDW